MPRYLIRKNTNLTQNFKDTFNVNLYSSTHETTFANVYKIASKSLYGLDFGFVGITCILFIE